MYTYVQQAIDFISQHSIWAGPLVGLAAFGESLAFVGLVIPGTAIMVGVGVAAGISHLPLWPILFLATLGAILGDGLSFLLGHRYRHSIRKTSAFSRQHGLMARGEAVVRRHGSKSVVLARFVPLLRPVVPLAAGAFGMSPLRFYIANILSAMVWAPIYVLSGTTLTMIVAALRKMSDRNGIAVLTITSVTLLGVWLGRRYLIRATRVALGERTP